ncbi:MAG: glycerophosphodiester phosphodiesterase family protein [Kineosporiaceae bacterium]
MSTPAVVAHRGASQIEPEHTLAAYRRALTLGVDGVECDVRLTADGHLVCVHDRDVRRTSDGRGLVSTLELTQLQGLDWGSWKDVAAAADAEAALLGAPVDREVPDVVEPGDRSALLTLARLLQTVAGARRPDGSPVEIAVETKHPTRYGSIVEKRLAQVLAEAGMDGGAGPSPVRVMSFSILALRRMRLLTPGVGLVWLLERVPPGLREGRLPRGVMAAGVNVEVIRRHPRYVSRVHERGGQVHVWTVDEPEDVQRCVDAGVDVVITNRPEAVLHQLGRG